MTSNLLFIDTSAFYAFFDKRDNQHNQVVKILQTRHEQFITSNYILDELITLFRVRGLVFEKFSPFVKALWNEEACNILRVSADIDLQAWQVLEKFKEHEFSFTDCTSFVLMKNYGIRKACTLDKHFQIAGFDIIY
jgi:predicted nucleic acid-binding protein